MDPKNYKNDLEKIFKEISLIPDNKWSYKKFHKILRNHPRDGSGMFSRNNLVEGYRYLSEIGGTEVDQRVLDRIKMRPTRTISGVTPVTVLTKPFPCPGKCIFCPNDVRMPKSYLRDEPGAQRAERNSFDPYLQTYNRLLALHNIGHNTSKVELIVLGGTWSFYPENYQIWFVKRCFDAMNDFGVEDNRDKIIVQNDFEEADKAPNRKIDGGRKSYNQIINEVVHNKGKRLISETEMSTWENLEDAHKQNENAQSRCIGLVIETRPDWINESEIVKFRRLGATKIQIGIQSLDDKVMELNKRGHGRKETENAIRLLRLGGFKVHAHWMPNLYGSTVENDILDYRRLWEKQIQPDELKVYPTSIISNTGLYDLYKKGEYKPYTYEELLKVMTEIMPLTPRYCRLTRIVRDIPSTDIVAGNKLTNFRQIAELELERTEKRCQCIRCREIKG
ncbi:tRNA uridine(34) 5-carboxymethylaminomethyl modification radical SAM/GNAT enzyme Elp3, partial [Candidatus Dojkabacteria bacterium]|nr:tRNA uridine(34) 5-carboxymethylaminomethyl modification radical SAM/GNAT enzyme Elp3 [Candidatus Dojkabacteria bacterium]